MIDNTLIVGFLGLVAAGIAGFFSILQLIISKENKISEFRQEWIDKLREELACVLSSVEALGASAEKGRQGENFSGALRNIANVLLRFNPAEHKEIVAKLESLQEEIIKMKADDITSCNFTNSLKQIENEAKIVLKSEWKRVKEGEPRYKLTYRIVRIVSIGSMISLVLASIVYCLSQLC
jgi:hypothetical protein